MSREVVIWHGSLRSIGELEQLCSGNLVPSPVSMQSYGDCVGSPLRPLAALRQACLKTQSRPWDGEPSFPFIVAVGATSRVLAPCTGFVTGSARADQALPQERINSFG